MCESLQQLGERSSLQMQSSQRVQFCCSGARGAGRHGVAHCVLPILSLVVLSRVAGVHWSARGLLSNGGEARDMIERNLSAPIAVYRHRAKFSDGRPDAKTPAAVTDCYAIQMLAGAGDN